jgi:hypothetical protein
MPREGAIIFRDIVGKLDLLRVECDKCGRRGQCGIDGLLKQYGPDIAMPDLRHELAQRAIRAKLSMRTGRAADRILCFLVSVLLVLFHTDRLLG